MGVVLGSQVGCQWGGPSQLKGALGLGEGPHAVQRLHPCHSRNSPAMHLTPFMSSQVYNLSVTIASLPRLLYVTVVIIHKVFFHPYACTGRMLIELNVQMVGGEAECCAVIPSRLTCSSCVLWHC